MNAEAKGDPGSREAELPEYFRTARSDVMQFVPSKFSRVLEVGCSAGRFSAVLADRGAEVWGVEPDHGAAEVARTKLRKVVTGTFNQAFDQLPDRYFDLVVCNDVIEHMPDHDWFLRAVQAKMTPDAVLIGSLPNIRHITALVKILAFRDFPYREEGILDRTHLRFFTKKSIVRTLQDNGYAVEAIRGVNSIVRDGIVRGTWAKNLFWRVATSAVVLGTFGFFADTVYPQYAFRASRVRTRYE